jgi:hypothetical protein
MSTVTVDLSTILSLSLTLIHGRQLWVRSYQTDTERAQSESGAHRHRELSERRLDEAKSGSARTRHLILPFPSVSSTQLVSWRNPGVVSVVIAHCNHRPRALYHSRVASAAAAASLTITTRLQWTQSLVSTATSKKRHP